MMRKWQFIISVVGIFVLLILTMELPVKSINSQKDLEKLVDNQKVELSGRVIKESQWGTSLLLTLDNKVQLICNCPKSKIYQNKNISALGLVSSFGGKRVKVLRLKEND